MGKFLPFVVMPRALVRVCSFYETLSVYSRQSCYMVSLHINQAVLTRTTAWMQCTHLIRKNNLCRRSCN